MYRFIVHVGDEYVLLGSTSNGTILYRWGMSMYCLVQLALELYCTGVLYRWGDEYVLLGTTSHETILYSWDMSMYCSVQLAVELYCTCVLYRWGMSMYCSVQLAVELARLQTVEGWITQLITSG